MQMRQWLAPGLLLLAGGGFGLMGLVSLADEPGKGAKPEAGKEGKREGRPEGGREGGRRGGRGGDDVHRLMERTHEGKRSPFAQVKSELAGEAPNWESLAKLMPTLQAMSKALVDTKNADVQQLSGGYADGVKKLSAAVEAKDLASAKAGLKAISASCTDCHSKGGPGGRLEEEGEREGPRGEKGKKPE